MLLDKAYAHVQITRQRFLNKEWARGQIEAASQHGMPGVRRGLSSNPYR